MTKLKFGLIGTGFMGKTHAIALQSVATIFPATSSPQLSCLVDSDMQNAERIAAEWGFDQASDHWQTVCSDPLIDVVDICTPNHLHKEMALAAIAAGKHVYCEKPLALTGADALQISIAAKSAGVRTSMGFNYICNPLITLVREMISSGEIGEVFNFRSSYQEDYLASPKADFSWRCLRQQGGSGALADLGTHLINMAEFILGPIESVFGALTTVHQHRRDPDSGKMRTVENEDIAQVLLTFTRDCPGSMEISRIATGKKCGLTFEVFGSKGSLAFDQENMNELRFYDSSDRSGRRGYRTILSAPEHPDYAAFCPAPGHGLGFNDLKVIEVRNLLGSIIKDEAIYSDFENGYRVQSIIDAIESSHHQRQWIDISVKQAKENLERRV